MSRLSEETCQYLNDYCDILRNMIMGMTNAELGCSISHNFILQMIPHHRGAVQMSCEALKNCLCSELRPILQDIVRSQKKGIHEMCCLLKCF